MNKKLLIVEDDVGLQSQLRWSFDDFEIEVAQDRVLALTLLKQFEPAVVTLDLGLPPDPGGVSEGFAVLQEALQWHPLTKIIVMTGNDSREHAVKAIGLGAYDFYQKPIDSMELNFVVNRAWQVYQLELENQRLQQQTINHPLQGVIAVDDIMLSVCQTVEKVANTDATTLFLGESGTGKELLVQSLHNLSYRAEQRCIAVNCAAIPENLLESELFGFEKGAFTGAVKSTPGKIELADKGTFFFDEVGDLPLSLQAKLLRFLQEKRIERIGGRKEIMVDVRVVCATHRNLQELIKQGLFREDLYYRLSEITITIPPLRQRVSDINVLAMNFLQTITKQQGRNIQGFTQDAITAMNQYHWPGNVRELENRIKRAVIMAEGYQINRKDLELESLPATEQTFNLKVAREKVELETVLKAMNHVSGNISQAAELLGITRPTLYSLINKYQIKVDAKVNA